MWCAPRRGNSVQPGVTPRVMLNGVGTSCKDKSIRNALICSAFALTGRKSTHACLPKVLPWAVGFCLFEACANDAALFDTLPQSWGFCLFETYICLLYTSDAADE